VISPVTSLAARNSLLDRQIARVTGFPYELLSVDWHEAEQEGRNARMAMLLAGVKW
jgi:hypothetical protein